MKIRWIGLIAASLVVTVAIAQSLKPLTVEVADTWRTLKGSTISSDGKWVAYAEGPAIGDTVMFAVSTDGATRYKVERGSGPRFSRDGKFLLFTLQPPKAEVDKARKDRKPPAEIPRAMVSIMDLSNGKVESIEKGTTFNLPDQDGGFFAYRFDLPPATTNPGGIGPGRGPGAGGGRPGGFGPGGGAPGGAGGRPGGGGGRPGGGPANPNEPGAEPAQPAEGQAEKPKKRASHAPGSETKFRQLGSDRELVVADVASYQFEKGGKTILAVISTKTGEGDGLYRISLPGGEKEPILTGLGVYSNVSRHDKLGSVMFYTDRDDYAATTPKSKIYLWQPGDKEAKPVLTAEDLPKGYQFNMTAGARFSGNGKRIILQMSQITPPEPRDETPEEDKVNVDIWHWKDPEIQPVQLLRAAAERSRSYDAVLDLTTKKLYQLENPEQPNVALDPQSDGNYAVIANDRPYAVEATWDQAYRDITIWNFMKDTRATIVKRYPGNLQFSTTGKYVYSWDEKGRKFWCMELATGHQTMLSSKIPYPVHDELHDRPEEPNPYGFGGWLGNDSRCLIYDRYDIWACDPQGLKDPVCLTDGYGRRWNIVLRPAFQRRDPEERTYRSGKIYLVGINEDTREEGIFLGNYAGGTPEKLIYLPKNIGALNVAQDADKLVTTLQDFREYPDLVATDLSFKILKKLSNLGEQVNEYAWGSAEAVSWISNDGVKLNGVLYKPANFDPGKQYPMVVYFYEREFDNLYNFSNPSYSGSAYANPSLYTSNGYVVFRPDIPYLIGYPGNSSMSAILPGVQSIITRGYVDPKRIGILGHSWGGYETAYLITRTNMFKCAVAGAAVSNMTSAYGGVRWGSGVLRQFQYEKTQSRIGGTLWEKPLQFIENSPLFWADRVNTPVLLMNNDKDGAVPWYQGIEFYAALRRLSKPVWMLNYNGQDHGLSRRPDMKDWTIRQFQFFEHYLKDKPMPVWMSEGVPATKKGKSFGLEVPAKP